MRSLELFVGKTFSDVLPPDAANACLGAIQEAAQQACSAGGSYLHITGRKI